MVTSERATAQTHVVVYDLQAITARCGNSLGQLDPWHLVDLIMVICDPVIWDDGDVGVEEWFGQYLVVQAPRQTHRLLEQVFDAIGQPVGILESARSGTAELSARLASTWVTVDWSDTTVQDALAHIQRQAPQCPLLCTNEVVGLIPRPLDGLQGRMSVAEALAHVVAQAELALTYRHGFAVVDADPEWDDDRFVTVAYRQDVLPLLAREDMDAYIDSIETTWPDALAREGAFIDWMPPYLVIRSHGTMQRCLADAWGVSLPAIEATP